MDTPLNNKQDCSANDASPSSEKPSFPKRLLSRMGLRRSKSPAPPSTPPSDARDDSDKENISESPFFKVPAVPKSRKKEDAKATLPERSKSPLDRLKRFSFRRKVRSGSGSDCSGSEGVSASESATSLSDERAATPNQQIGMIAETPPRPALSETDVRFLHINTRRGTEGAVTPLLNVTAMSMDNISTMSATPKTTHDATVATPSGILGGSPNRSPSYLRISAAAHGYPTIYRSPEGTTNVERMKARFQQMQSRAFDEMRTPVRTSASRSNTSAASTSTTSSNLPIVHTPRSECHGVDSAEAVMGHAASTPSPIKALIAKMENLSVCPSRGKGVDDYEDDKENCKVEPQLVVKQPQINDVAKENVDDVEEKHDETSEAEIAPLQKEIAVAQVAEGASEHASQQAIARQEQATQVSSGVEAQTVAEEPKLRATIIQVKPRVHPGEKKEEEEKELSIDSTAAPMSQNGSATTLDGIYFSRLVAAKREELEKKQKEGDADLQKVEALPEADDAAEVLRAAVGNATLLLRKKIPRFEQLVERNLHPIENDPEPVKVGDLQGWWDMVMIELDSVEELFKKAEAWRKNGWKQPADEVSTGRSQPARTAPPSAAPKKPSRPATSTTSTTTTQANDEKRKAEAERRKQMMREAREKMKQHQQQQTPNGGSAVPDGLLVL